MPVAFYGTVTSVITFRVLWNGDGYFKSDYPLDKKQSACRLSAFVASMLVTMALGLIG